MGELLKIELEFDKEIGYFVSSRTIAEGLGKRHDHVLRDLDELIKGIPKSGEAQKLIITSSYVNKQNKQEYRDYKLTKDGFTLYMFHIQGFTEFKMAYINRFNEMESFIKQSYSNLKKIEVDGKFDWAIKRMRDRLNKAEHIENQIAYLFDSLKEEYTKIMLDSECKIKSVSTFFYDFKTPEKYDASKEPLPFITNENNSTKKEYNIEKEFAEKIDKLGLDKDKVLEEAIKMLEQKGITKV